MKKVKIITAKEAAELVKDNDTLTSIGFVSCAHPEALTKALEQRFLETGSPRNLTYMYAASQGKRDGRGGEHLAHEGLLKRIIIGHYQTVPAIGKLAVEKSKRITALRARWFIGSAHWPATKSAFSPILALAPSSILGKAAASSMTLPRKTL